MAPKRIFVAYPGTPGDVGATIERAKGVARNLIVDTWKREDLGGQALKAPILKAIEAADVVVADVTFLNFNVTYELGFAIGEGKRVLPTVNSAFEADKATRLQVGVFDTLVYENYSTADGFLALLDRAEPGRRIATDYPRDPQPLYIVLPPVMTDDASQLLVMATRAGLRPRTFDPREQSRLSATEAVRAVGSSSGVVVPLLSADMKDAAIHNIRGAFVAGVAHALDLPVLLLQKGTWETPLDIRDDVKSYTTEEQLQATFTDFAARVHDARYSAQLPSSGSDNALANLRLGDPAAENEESILGEYFLERDQFRQVLDGRANIVVGRKGSGKSAVFFQVRDRLRAARSNVILDLSPEGHQLRKLKDLVLRWLAAGSKEFLLSAFWEYVLLLELCAKMIDKDEDVHKRNPDLFEPYQMLLSYFKADSSTSGTSFSDRLVKLIERLAYRYKASYGEKEEVDLSDGALTNILYQTEISRLRRQVIDYATRKGIVFILFDNVDKSWNASGLEETDIFMVRTLIDAGRKLGNDFRRYDIDFRCAVFVRNDVYEMLVSKTPDRGKETSVTIDWLQGEHLKQMLRRRLQYNTSVKNLTIDQLWHNICVPMIAGQHSLDFLLARSLMRPRYFLRLINHCRGSAVNFGRDRIDSGDIEAGLSVYSTDVITEIGLEIRDIYPESDGILYVFLGEPREMPKSEVERLLLKALKDEDKVLVVLALLFWHGVLGFRRSPHTVNYIHDINYDLKRLMGAMQKSTDVDPMLQVSPALWPGLEMQ